MSRSHIIQPESKPWNPWHIPHIPPGSWEEVPREVLLCRLDGPRALRPAGGMRLHPLAFQAGPAKSWTWSLNPGHGQVKKDVFVGYICYNVEKCIMIWLLWWCYGTMEYMTWLSHHVYGIWYNPPQVPEFGPSCLRGVGQAPTSWCQSLMSADRLRSHINQIIRRSKNTYMLTHDYIPHSYTEAISRI